MDNLRELIGNIKEIEKDLPEGEDALRHFRKTSPWYPT